MVHLSENPSEDLGNDFGNAALPQSVHSNNSYVFRRATSGDDISQMETLQNLNLRAVLDVPTQLAKGFLSVGFSSAQFEEMNAILPIFIAEQERQLAGYLVASPLSYADQFQLPGASINCFKQSNFLDPGRLSRIVMLGPVCVAAEHRGNGVMASLYRKAFESLARDFDLAITFISLDNPASVRAHTQSVGFQILDEFIFNHSRYALLIRPITPYPETSPPNGV